VLPYWQFISWLAEYGRNARLFVQELFATHISAFCALEVIVSAVVVLRFIRTESRRLRINHRLARHCWLFAGRRFAGPGAISVSS